MRYLFAFLAGAIFLALAVGVIGGLFSWDSTDVDEVGLHYSGGPIEGRKFETLVGPSTSGSFYGPFDKLVKLPANQRTYIISKEASGGDVAGFVSAKNAEGVEIEYETTMWFRLNTKPDVVRRFYEDVCTKYDDCQGSGWDQMLADNLRKAQETALQSTSRRYSTDAVAQEGDTLAEIQRDVADALKSRVNDNLGGPYFVDMRFQVNDVDIPQRIAEGYDDLKRAELVTQTRKQEVAQAEQQALAADKLASTLNENPNYLELRRIQMMEEAVKGGKIEFWVLPEDATMTAPSR